MDKRSLRSVPALGGEIQADPEMPGNTARHSWPVFIQTRSPLVLRDIDILKEMKTVQVGFSIPTADDGVRKLFEPHAPPIGERIRALDELHKAGIRTYAMIAPILPGAGLLPEALNGKVDYVMVDRLNYNHADWVFTKYKLRDKVSDDFYYQTGREIAGACGKLGIDCRLVF